MSIIRLSHKGDLKRTKKFLESISRREYLELLDQFGKEGVYLLASATPRDSGITAQSWDYRVDKSFGQARLVWTNTSVTKSGDCIALLLQYGHGTGTGGYVTGIDYINPALEPLFRNAVEIIWKKVNDL